MLEITEPARRLLGEAWRKGRVLVVRRPWREYRAAAALVGIWCNADDDRELSGTMRVGEGEWVYIPSDLLPDIRHRKLRLELHSVLGFWRGIAVRELDPAPVFVTDETGLWPRVRTPRG